MFQVNVRNSEMVIGDLNGMLSACRIAEKQLQRVFDKYGAEQFRNLCNELFDYTEALAADTYRSWPQGSFDFQDAIDGDGLSRA